MFIEHFNKYFLCNFNDLTKVDDLPEELHKLWLGEEWTEDQLASVLLEWQAKRNSSLPDEEQDRESTKQLSHVIALTLMFIQTNFSGPPLKQSQAFSDWLAVNSLPDWNPFDQLMVNGEEINPNVKFGEFLVVAREMLKQLLGKWTESLFLQWWHMRLTCLQQQIIDELTGGLYEQFKSASEFLLKRVACLKDKELEALLYLELANGYLLFQRAQKSSDLLEELCQRLNVQLNVEGLLGVRTKFQKKPLPQLCLKVQQAEASSLPSSSQTNSNIVLPKLLLHEDDTRLERIRFIDAQDNEVMTLPSVLQALVLAKVKQLKRSQPKDRLADEELEPYIQTLLYQETGPLQVRQSALLLNCLQECDQRRTVERSWKQCEEVVKLLSEPSTTYSLPQRLSYSFTVCLQPKWQVQLQLCDLLLSLGMTKSALDIYLQIQAWEQVIHCYTRLELRHKAAEIIQQELAKKPTVLLHCLLGDATDDASCYATAWEFSKQTSGKAQAHWGNYYFQRREYEQAIPHLERSVEINSLQEKIWLRLGYAAISMERWELAVHAYITYTHLEPLGFESWNNLAKALVKLGDKKRAHRVLSESLKCNYTNWKVWENFMLVSVDTGNFEDALNSYNRLSELKERYLDLEVLCVLATAIAEDKPDAKGQSPARLRKKASTLLGHQCIKHGNEPKVWELAALLAPTPLNKAQKLVKAYSAFTKKDPVWSTQQPSALKVLQICHDLCNNSLEAITQHGDDESAAMITSQLSSARLSAQGCVRTVEKEAEKWPENQEILAGVQQLLERLTEQLKQRMSSS